MDVVSKTLHYLPITPEKLDFFFWCLTLHSGYDDGYNESLGAALPKAVEWRPAVVTVTSPGMGVGSGGG